MGRKSSEKWRRRAAAQAFAERWQREDLRAAGRHALFEAHPKYQRALAASRRRMKP